MKVLVTCGSGYLGTHIKNFFSADDLSRRSGGDITISDDVERIAEYDMVIHAAAHLDKLPDAADQCFKTNVDGTVNILRNIREDACFIYLSTKDIYGAYADSYYDVPESCPTSFTGQSALEWSKLIGEQYVEFYANTRKFRSCIFRLSTTFAPISEGNRPGFVGHYANAINFGERLKLPGGGIPVRDVMHVDDLSRACSAFQSSVIRHGKYNLGGGRKNAVSLMELVKKMEDVSGLQAVIDEESPLPMPTPVNYVTDLSLISQELDWSCEMSVEEGLKTLFRTF